MTLETTFDHLPTRERMAVSAGGQFVDFGDSSDEFARLFQLPPLGEARMAERSRPAATKAS